MKIILICVAQYILGVFLCWYYNKLSFSKGGKEEDIEPEFGEFVIMVIPFLNIFAGVFCFIFNFPNKRKTPRKWTYSKIFCVKKESNGGFVPHVNIPQNNEPAYFRNVTQQMEDAMRFNQQRVEERIREMSDPSTIAYPKRFSLKKKKIN